MRLIEYKGKKAEITEDNWKRLMRRFNPEGMTEEGRRVRCPLCSKLRGCGECPLKTFARGGMRVGCVVLMQAVIRRKIGILYKAWIKPGEVYGIGNIRKIYEAIENLPQV